MAQYTSKDQIIEAMSERTLAELTDDVNGAAVNDALVTRYISQETAFAIAYLRARGYVLPDSTNLGNVPIELQVAVTDMTIYRLHSRRLTIPEDVKVNKQTAMQFLNDIKDGLIILDLPTRGENTPSASVSWSPPQVFGDDFFAGY